MVNKNDRYISFLHSILGHPMMAWCTFFGYKELGVWFHDVTLYNLSLKSLDKNDKCRLLASKELYESRIDQCF